MRRQARQEQSARTRAALASIARGVIAERREGRAEVARVFYADGLALAQAMKNPWLGAWALGFLTGVELAAGRHERASEG
jgi:hypothetical protein